jgi:hypothetical protein
VIDALPRVQQVHNEAVGAGLVHKLNLPPLDDQERVWPLALAKENPSRWVGAASGEASKRLDVVPRQLVEVLLLHRRP